MRLWLITIEYESVQYDADYGFVVAAPDEVSARALVRWYDRDGVTCVEIRPEDYREPRIILRDFNAG